jgi:Ca2+-binding EF-hand superfamily protein
VKALFNFMDTDRDGNLSLSEARHAWKLLGLDTAHDGSAVNRMLTDANRSGDLREVDCGLFVRGALLNTQLTDEQRVHKAFNLADRTLSGKLDLSAMKGMVETSAEAFSEEHIKDLMSVVDSTGSGEFVTVEDFYKFKLQRQKGLEWRAEKERLGLAN